MADDKGYNGWSNYETWKSSSHDKDDTISDLAKELEQYFDDNMPEVQGTYADLLGAALSEVNWYEIAEAMVGDEDLQEDEDDDDAPALEAESDMERDRR